MPGTHPPNIYLTRRELATHLRVSTKTLIRWERPGLPSERWGSHLVRYHLPTTEKWLKNRNK